MIEETINLLGMVGRDKVTGYKGMISSVHFDTYGCVMICLSPEMDKEGKLPQTLAFDIDRIEIQNQRIMDIPDFREMSRIKSVKAEEISYPHGAAETAIRA